jgi:corrinoid protein of di/trimethylamine methyltransferase
MTREPAQKGEKMAEEAQIFEQLKQAVMDGDEEAAVAQAEAVVAAGIDPQKAIMQGLAAGMAEMGRLYEQEECYVPELMVSSEALYAGLGVLQPLVAASGAAEKKGVAVIGAVQGDIHDIGKNLVKMMLEVSGIEVHDLGRDVEMEKFIDAVKETNADLLCMSALMTTTIIAIKDYMPAFKAKLPGVKIMIGGAPLNQHLADEWGADGYGDNAMEAARVAVRLLAGK